MLHMLQVSYFYTTECNAPVQNALECLTLQIWMTSGGDKLCRDHRIIEWVRLEKNTVGPLAQSPSSHRVPYSMLIRSTSRWLLNIPREGISTTSLDNLFQRSEVPSHIPISAHCFSSCCSSPRALVLPLDLLLSNISDINKIPFQSALLQAEQSQLPQALLMNEVLQYPPHLCCLPLDLFQELHISLVLRSSELVTALQMQTHQGWVEQQDNLSWPPYCTPRYQ